MKDRRNELSSLSIVNIRCDVNKARDIPKDGSVFSLLSHVSPLFSICISYGIYEKFLSWRQGNLSIQMLCSFSTSYIQNSTLLFPYYIFKKTFFVSTWLFRCYTSSQILYQYTLNSLILCVKPYCWIEKNGRNSEHAGRKFISIQEIYTFCLVLSPGTILALNLLTTRTAPFQLLQLLWPFWNFIASFFTLLLLLG